MEHWLDDHAPDCGHLLLRIPTLVAPRSSAFGALAVMGRIAAEKSTLGLDDCGGPRSARPLVDCVGGEKKPSLPTGAWADPPRVHLIKGLWQGAGGQDRARVRRRLMGGFQAVWVGVWSPPRGRSSIWKSTTALPSWPGLGFFSGGNYSLCSGGFPVSALGLAPGHRALPGCPRGRDRRHQPSHARPGPDLRAQEGLGRADPL